ncbi:MAG: DUF86 domain-containing protein [Spirochaetaceae bacterium]|nr:MAG: DUF86 domain-containing protein [Spirochaetaceae bacterium]
MSERDRASLLAMLDAVTQIEIYTTSVADASEFHSDRLVFDGTLMNFVLLGEMCARVSEELRARNTDIEWSQIKDFRNLVAHNYMGIDAEEVWQIIQDDLPPLKARLRDLTSDDTGVPLPDGSDAPFGGAS